LGTLEAYHSTTEKLLNNFNSSSVQSTKMRNSEADLQMPPRPSKVEPPKLNPSTGSLNSKYTKTPNETQYKGSPSSTNEHVFKQ